MNAAPVTVSPLPLPGVDARIRAFRAEGEVDSFVLLAERLAVIVDTQSTPDLMRQVLDHVRGDLTGRRVVVLNTHADWDHVYGNRLFGTDGDCPAPILGGVLTRERLVSAQARETLAAQQAQDARFRDVRLVPPDVTVQDGDTVHGGDLSVTFVATPGHTPDHHSLWIPELGTLLAGDAAEFPFPQVQRGADLPVLLGSLRRLQTLGARVVLPCHGGTTTPDLLAWNLAHFEHLRAQLSGLPDPEVQATDPDRAALEAGVPYEAVLARLGTRPDDVPDFYRDFHRDAVRATLEDLHATP